MGTPKAILSFQQRGNQIGPNLVDEGINNHSTVVTKDLDEDLDRILRGNNYRPLTKTHGPYGYVNEGTSESEFTSVQKALQSKYGKGEHMFKGGIYKIIFGLGACVAGVAAYIFL